MNENTPPDTGTRTWLERMILACMQNKVIVLVLTIIVIGWGLVVAPFDWNLGGLMRDPIPVDAIPDIGENQQIVFTEWTGRSPQDVEDQITYPLSASLLGLPGVKSIRGYSMFGFSLIYVIFKDDIDFYWARSRVLESLSSLPARELPETVKPALGPDATALGQVFWYTLEGHDDDGNPTGGWDLHELRKIQDWYVRYALMSVDGVSEVASVGGFIPEYQIDVDPDKLRYRNVRLEEVVDAVRRANVDVGARTIEVNRVEYIIRGLGFIKNTQHIEDALIKMVNGTPIMVKHVANVIRGPATRRGALDKGGVETVGGVVVVRFGENPLEVIKRVKQKIEEISPGLPSRSLSDGRVSQVKVVPFYDRSGLIHETLETLRSALTNEVLVTIIIVLVMMVHLRSSILISGMLPLTVLLCFIAMKVFRVDANIVALSGIAIAIGTIVDMGIIVTENILRQMDKAGPDANRFTVILQATSEVGSSVITAGSTTIISFLPIFTMVAAEGKLFRPLAFTKTFTLLGSIVVALCVIPPLIHVLYTEKLNRVRVGRAGHVGLILLGGVLVFVSTWKIGGLVALLGGYNLLLPRLPEAVRKWCRASHGIVIVLGIGYILTRHWLPLGPSIGLSRNYIFVMLVIGCVAGSLRIFRHYYIHILGWCLAHKAIFMVLPLFLLVMGGTIWQGYDTVFGWMPRLVSQSSPGVFMARLFPGIGKEFMPPLDEGSYLYMPVTMPHASIGEVLDILQRQDKALKRIPEVKTVVGKLGRVESPLDPAPISMIETVIDYKTEYFVSDDGSTPLFRFHADEADLVRGLNGEPLPARDGKIYHVMGRFERDMNNQLIPNSGGRPFRLWRPALEPALNPGRQAWAGIRKPDDIWDAILRAADIVGTTVAPKLQPISARMVMLQSGIRSNMGVKVHGPDLATVEKVGRHIEKFLRQMPEVDPRSVIADRIMGKPYLEIDIDRWAIAQYGIYLQQVQDVIEIAIGGKMISSTVEGRERYPVRVRYMRELRDDIESLGRVLVPSSDGTRIPLIQLATINYVPGPQTIKSENTFITGYVLFDKKPGYAETDVVEAAREYLLEKIEYGELLLPHGTNYSFAGNYENQVRAEKKLKLILPLALALIFIILYSQFKSITTTALVFSGVAVAWAGGFVMLWLYGHSWFLDFSFMGVSMRELFQVHSINLSIAVWVGFLALFGIASDDGVVMATYLNRSFSERRTDTIPAIRQATVEASLRRVKPCLMTTATTILALIPVLTSTGRGSDILVPMAVPSFGGMALGVITMLVVPVLYSAVEEFKLRRKLRRKS